MPPDLPKATYMVPKREVTTHSLVRILSFDELEQVTPATWLVRGVMRQGDLVVAFGPPDSGKTFLLLSMLCSIATGATWCDREVTSGAILYLAAESARGVHVRLRAWLHHNPGLKDLIRERFNMVARPVQILDEQDLEGLVQAIDAMKEPPVIIVFDTLARSLGGGDENSAADMGAFIARCDELRERFGSTVVLVHHSGLPGFLGHRG